MANPHYVETPGDQQVSPPYMFKKMRSLWYALPADGDKLQRLCDKYLNRPSRGKPFYKNLFPYVFVQLNSYPEISAASAPGQVMSAEEVGLSLWLLRLPDFGMPFFQPFLFIDNPWSVVTGRSVFGFNKIYSSFDLGDGSPEGFGETRVESLVFPSMESSLSLENILQVKTQAPPGILRDQDTFTDPSRFLHELAGRLHKQLLVDEREFRTATAGELGFELDTLKQFRDAERPETACYQAIVSTPMKIKKFQGGPLLGGEWSLDLKKYASLPIDELGIKSNQPVLAFELNLDCEFGPGRNLFVNTGTGNGFGCGCASCLAAPFGWLFGRREGR